MSDIKIVNEVTSDQGVFQMRSDGILVFRLNTSSKKTTLDDLSKQVETFTKLQNGKPGPFLMITKEINPLGNDEKIYIREQLVKVATSFAIVTNSQITNFMFNLFLYLYKPQVKSKLFKSEEAAIVWLKSL